MFRAQHKPLPMELLVPQMNTTKLDTRWRQIINCKKALVRFMGTDEYVGVTRVLPHFSEPDLVFGNIGGEIKYNVYYTVNAHIIAQNK